MTPVDCQSAARTPAAPPVWNFSAPWPTNAAPQLFTSNTSYYPTATVPAGQTLSQLSLTSQQPAAAGPIIPHHTLGGGNFNGPSSQLVKTQGQISVDEQSFLYEVFNADPGLFSLYAANLRDLSYFKARYYFQSIRTCVINLNDREEAQVLALSDDGACLNLSHKEQIMSHSLATGDKRHKEPCAMSERFKCKVCTENGDFAGA